MKNLNFENFNYSVINSAKTGYKEVLVSYEANGQRARNVVFVKEVKGKSNAYYISEAKKRVESQINTGSLAKSTSKQIKHANSKGILKPTLVALAVMLGLGALGASGYFTYKYFTNLGGGDVPPEPQPVITGHTVVLFAGDEGKFKNNFNYLIVNNVPDQTALGNVEGYEEPEYINNEFIFDKWKGPIEANTYATSFKITADIVLNATWKEGVGPAKEEETEAINENAQAAIEELEGNEVAQGAVTSIADSTTKAIKEATDEEIVRDLSDFANNTIGAVVDYADREDIVKAINRVYLEDLDKIAKEENVDKRGSILKNCTGYLDALQYVDGAVGDTCLDQAFDDINKQIDGYTDEQQNEIQLIGHLSVGIQSYAATLNSKEGQKEYKETWDYLNEKNEVLLTHIEQGDEDSVELVGSTEADYLASKANLVGNENYANFVNGIAMQNIDQLQYAIDGFDTAVASAEFNINRTLVSSFTKLDANLLDDKNITRLKAPYQSGMIALSAASVACEDEGGVSEEGINQVTEAFQNSLEAFADNPDVDATFGYLLSTEDGQGLLVEDNIKLMLKAEVPDLYTNARKEAILNATKSAKKVAVAAKLDETSADFKLLYDNFGFVNHMTKTVHGDGIMTSANEKYITDAFSVFTDIAAVTDYDYENDKELSEKEYDLVKFFFGSPLPSELMSYNSRMFYSINMGAAKIKAVNGNESITTIITNSTDTYRNKITIIDCYNKNISATAALVDLLEKVYDDYTLSIYNNLGLSSATYSIQVSLSKNLSGPIKNLEGAKIDEFKSYFNTFDNLLSSFDDLVRMGPTELFYPFTDYIGFTDEGYYSGTTLLDYFFDNFSLMPEFETAVNENLTSKLSGETEISDLEGYISDTNAAIEKIIGK